MQKLPIVLIPALMHATAVARDEGAELAEAFDAQPAQRDSRDIAKKLANPLADLISVPMQLNFDEGFGSDEDGTLLQLNVQPVIPFTLNEDWLLISRSIVPIIYQHDIPMDGDDQFGMGDILQSFFFSPAELTNGWVLGAGPAMLLPTATDDVLGTEKWSFGPTAVALRQEGPWTVGVLANHLWSVSGPDDRTDINATYLEPWVSFVTNTDTTISISAETTYDWEMDAWSVPVVFTVDQLFQIGNQYISIGAAAKYWTESPEGGPEGLGFRLQVTLLFPN